MNKLMLNKQQVGGYEIYEQNPVGTIISFAGNNAPTGYLRCNGQAVSRTDYAELFSVIGTVYGEGDGVNTFNVPDLRESALVGIGRNTTKTIDRHDEYTLGQFKQDQFQSHSHSLETPFRYGYSSDSVAVSGDGDWTYYRRSSNTVGTYNSGATSGGTHGKQTGINFCIKAVNTSAKDSSLIDDSTTDVGHAWSGQKVSDMLSYSTEEKVVGKWLDGKPLYERTIEYSYSTGESKKLFNFQEWNVKKFVKCSGWGYNTTSPSVITGINQRPIPSYVSDSDYADIWINTNNDVFIYSKGYRAGHITFWYTKTTD